MLHVLIPGQNILVVVFREKLVWIVRVRNVPAASAGIDVASTGAATPSASVGYLSAMEQGHGGGERIVDDGDMRGGGVGKTRRARELAGTWRDVRLGMGSEELAGRSAIAPQPDYPGYTRFILSALYARVHKRHAPPDDKHDDECYGHDHEGALYGTLKGHRNHQSLNAQYDIDSFLLRTFVRCKLGSSGFPVAVGLGKNGLSELPDAVVVDDPEELSESCVGVPVKLELSLSEDGTGVVAIDAVVVPELVPDPEGSAAWGARRTRWCGAGMIVAERAQPKSRVRARKGEMS